MFNSVRVKCSTATASLSVAQTQEAEPSMNDEHLGEALTTSSSNNYWAQHKKVWQPCCAFPSIPIRTQNILVQVTSTPGKLNGL